MSGLYIEIHVVLHYFLDFFSYFIFTLKCVILYRRAFRDELELLQKIRHPNVVQFLGAVTQSSPMMIVTEYLPKVFLILQSLALIKFQLMIDFLLNGLLIYMWFCSHGVMGFLFLLVNRKWCYEFSSLLFMPCK